MCILIQGAAEIRLLVVSPCSRVLRHAISARISDLGSRYPRRFFFSPPFGESSLYTLSRLSYTSLFFTMIGGCRFFEYYYEKCKLLLFPAPDARGSIHYTRASSNECNSHRAYNTCNTQQRIYARASKKSGLNDDGPCAACAYHTYTHIHLT